MQGYKAGRDGLHDQSSSIHVHLNGINKLTDPCGKLLKFHPWPKLGLAPAEISLETTSQRSFKENPSHSAVVHVRNGTTDVPYDIGVVAIGLHHILDR